MKKFFLLTILLLLTIWSCGTRSVEKNKSVQKSEENTSQNSEVKKDISILETTKFSTENNSESKYSSETKTEEKTKDSEQKIETKSNSENSESKYSNTEYYENGNVKSKTEYSATQSKLLQENSDLKKESEYFKSSAESLLEENKSLTISNLNLEKETKVKSDSIGNYKKQIENYSLQKSNNTERDFSSFWLYVFIFSGGFAFAHLFKFLWKKLINSQWYLKLIKKQK